MAKKPTTPQKRRLFQDLEGIEPGSATIHCAIETLSDVKESAKGVKYYRGIVSDGKNKVPIVGFDVASQEKLSSYHLKQEPVLLDSCIIKKSRSDDLEILVNKTTVVTQSPKKFDVKVIPAEITKETDIINIENMADGTKVTLNVSVVYLAPVRAVSTGTVQDVTISDSSGSINLSVWGENVEKLEIGKQYKLTDVYIRSYQGEKNVVFSRSSKYELLNDAGTTATVIEDEDTSEVEAIIIGCTNFNVHVSCLHCSAKLIRICDDSKSVRCQQCNIVQLMNHRSFEVSANVLFQAKDGEKHMLKMTTSTLLKILPDMDSNDSEKELQEELLQSPAMKVIYTKKTCYVKEIEFNKD